MKTDCIGYGYSAFSFIRKRLYHGSFYCQIHKVKLSMFEFNRY